MAESKAVPARRIDPHTTCLVHLEALPCESCTTDLEQLAGLECPECGPVVDEDGTTMLSAQEIVELLAGDANGFMRCPNDWCDEELEPTLEASLDMLKMVAERMPEMGPVIAQQLTALADEQDGHSDAE